MKIMYKIGETENYTFHSIHKEDTIEKIKKRAKHSLMVKYPEHPMCNHFQLKSELVIKQK